MLLRSASRRWLTRIFSARVSARPRRSRPSGHPLRQAAVDLVDQLDRGGGGDLGGHVRSLLRRRALDTSIRQVREIRYQSIADDLRTPGRAGASSPPGASCPSEAELSASLRGQPDHGPQGARGAPRRGPGRRPAGLRLVRGRRPAAPVARPARHDRGPAGRLGRALGAPRPRLRLRPRPARGRARCSAPTTVLEVRRLNLADGEPFARVTVWCPERPGRLDLAGRRRARHVLRAARRPARRRRADHRRRRSPRRTTPRCSRCPSARRCCAASGSPRRPTAGPCCSPSTCSPPTAPSSWSTSRWPTSASPRAASASSARAAPETTLRDFREPIGAFVRPIS